jgi:16S rRNA (adenine1518-N6/adenine1519-N6)-dimethyltransferase
MSQHQARKRFGQHFLVDEGILNSIVLAIRPTPNENIVEIGPGLGAMTQWVLPYVDQLHVVEIDRDLVRRLRHGKMADKLVVHEADALSFDFSSLPQPLRIIGNLPYNISSPLLFHLAQFAHNVVDQHFMLQKEVIDRMAASPGKKDYGRLTVMLQSRYEIEHLFDVPPEAFDPPPRVMSAIVRMTPLKTPLLHPEKAGIFSALVAQAFSQRRKMLRNTLGVCVAAEALEAAGFDLTRRAEEVAVETYINLANSLTEFPAQSMQ